MSLAGGALAASEKPAALAPGAVDEPAGVADSMSALSLSGQEAMQTLNTLCKSAVNGGTLSTTGLALKGVHCHGAPSSRKRLDLHSAPCFSRYVCSARISNSSLLTELVLVKSSNKCPQLSSRCKVYLQGRQGQQSLRAARAPQALK